jgi:predicted RNA-binding Zn ribbon-like protein
MPPDASPFPLLGEPLALDLLNTVVAAPDGPRDLLASPAALLAWTGAQAGRLPPEAVVPPADVLPRVRALREALRALFAAAVDGPAPAPEAVAAVNAAAAAAPGFPQLAWAPPAPPHAHLAYPTGRPGDALLAAVAASGIALLAGDDRRRLRRCDGPGCVLLFLATNPRRRWCSARGCGNRVRVARHYRRHHQA